MKILASLLLLLASLMPAQALETITVRFPRPQPQPACSTQAILVDNQGTLATVYSFGVEPDKGQTEVGGKMIDLELIAHDPVSRLTLLRLPESSGIKLELASIGSSQNLSTADGLRAAGELARFAGTEKLFHGQLLPLALLRFNYQAKGVRPGEPILNAAGEVVALALEGRIGEGNTGYALPIEVYHRVARGKIVNQQIQRCWLGVIMDAENTIPSLVGLRPDSPASKAGMQRDDILVSIAGRPINEYADAVNAFFYLRSGQKALVKVLRGTELLELEVIPEIVPTAQLGE